MIAFKLTHKDRSNLVAGGPDLGFLYFILCASGHLGPDSQGTRGLADRFEVDMDLRGSTARANRHDNESLVWVRTQTDVGDVVTIEVVETEQVDEPAHRRSKKSDRGLWRLPMRRRRARRRRGVYKRRHSTYPPNHDD
jgi:hypothetical protein